MNVLIFLLWGCTPKTTTVSKKQDNCGNLSDVLQKIVQAEDPLKYAQEKSLLANDTHVRVTLTLQEGAEVFWAAPIETELSVKQRYQLLVPPQKLCGLAQDGRVVEVDIPKTASPKTKSPKVSPK